MHNNSVFQGLGKLRFYYRAQNLYKKLKHFVFFFRLLLRSTAAAVKSGGLSNVQIFIIFRYKNIFMYIFLMKFRDGLEKIHQIPLLLLHTYDGREKASGLSQQGGTQ